jgi:hypothetical protein
MGPPEDETYARVNDQLLMGRRTIVVAEMTQPGFRTSLTTSALKYTNHGITSREVATSN